MQKKITLGLVAVSALLIAVSVFYIGGSDKAAAPHSVAPASATAATADSSKAPTGEPINSTMEETVYMFPQPDNFSSNPAQQDWETEILKFARGPGEDLAKVERLLSMWPRMDADGKQLIMEQAVQLIPDKDYMRYRTRLVSLAQTDELREAVMVDVLSRDDELRFTSLVEFLRQPPNKGQEDIKEVLVAYLEKDYGSDINAWEKAVKKFVEDNK